MKRTKKHPVTSRVGLFPVSISVQSDGLYRAECFLFQNCWVDSPSLEEVIADIQDAIEICLLSESPSEEDGVLVETEVPFQVTVPVPLG
jgi:predicted RNase H-like HicB family nuclease